MPMEIRRATVEDAASIAAVLNAVIAEGDLTAFEAPFSSDQERQFILSLGPRSILHVADEEGDILGVQSVDQLSWTIPSMSHVATIGTWLRADARGRAIGRRLFERSVAFARSSGYTKIVIQVLAGNARALRFYRRLGFQEIGVARKHVRIEGVFHDEIYLELQLDS
jgi:L-amino acid N-acyltransferase YncA